MLCSTFILNVWDFFKARSQENEKSIITRENYERIISLLENYKLLQDEKEGFLWRMKVDQLITDIFGTNSEIYKIFSKQIDISQIDGEFGDWKFRRKSSGRHKTGRINRDFSIDSQALDWELFWLDKIR